MKWQSPHCPHGGGAPETDAVRAPGPGEGGDSAAGFHISATRTKGTWLRALGSPSVIPEENLENPF